jgi:hypothetical protein
LSKDTFALIAVSAMALAASAWGYALARDGALRGRAATNWREQARHWRMRAFVVGLPLAMWILFALQLRRVLAGAPSGPADPVKMALQGLQVAVFAALAAFLVYGRRWRLRGNPLRSAGRAAWRRESALRALIRELADDPDPGPDMGDTLDAFVDYADLEWLEQIAAHLAAQSPPRRLSVAIDATDEDDPGAEFATPKATGDDA